MTPKIVEATEVQFEDIRPVDIPLVEELKTIPTERPATTTVPVPNQDEPITLHDLVIHDIFGKPWNKYKSVTLHPAPRESDGKHSLNEQSKWIGKAKKEGKEIPSLPLLYAIIEKLHTEKHPAEASLLAEFNESWFCTSTRLDYQTNTIYHEFEFPSQYKIASRHFPDTYWSEYARCAHRFKNAHLFQFEKEIKDADAYFQELLGNDNWYELHREEYIAVSAHPKAYVTAQNEIGLKSQENYKKLGTFLLTIVHKDEKERRRLYRSPLIRRETSLERERLSV